MKKLLFTLMLLGGLTAIASAQTTLNVTMQLAAGSSWPTSGGSPCQFLLEESGGNQMFLYGAAGPTSFTFAQPESFKLGFSPTGTMVLNQVLPSAGSCYTIYVNDCNLVQHQLDVCLNSAGTTLTLTLH